MGPGRKLRTTGPLDPTLTSRYGPDGSPTSDIEFVGLREGQQVTPCHGARPQVNGRTTLFPHQAGQKTLLTSRRGRQARLVSGIRDRSEVRRFPASRRFVTAGLAAGRKMATVHGIFSADVTVARDRLDQMTPPRPTFTAFVVACVGRAAAMHPTVHAYRDWRGRLIVPHQVDVATLVEVTTADGSFPLAHLIRDTGSRSVVDIGEELRNIKAAPTSGRSGMLMARVAPLMVRVPGAVRLFYLVLARSPRMRTMAGTVAVSSIGMFGGGGGYAIGQPIVATLNVYVGGMSERPHVVDGEIVVRRLLDVTVSVDHRIVDGAPAARFAADLRRLLESGDVLD